jgi:hypothetical protein
MGKASKRPVKNYYCIQSVAIPDQISIVNSLKYFDSEQHVFNSLKYFDLLQDVFNSLKYFD